MEIGFAEAPAQVVEYRKEQQMNNPLLLPLWLVSSPVLEPSQPHFFRCFTPQIKKGRENFGLFLFFECQVTDYAYDDGYCNCCYND